MTTTTVTDTSKNYAALPLQPLWNQARLMAASRDEGEAGSDTFTDILFAKMIGHNVRAVARWKKVGELPWFSADEAAVSLGLLPILIWGDDWLDVKGDFAAIAAGQKDKEIGKTLRKMRRVMDARKVEAEEAE